MRRTPPAPRSRFPAAWPWFMDEAVPTWVKDHYSPKESWKGKPFVQDDVRFFSKGVKELSELFTEERPREIPTYFNHPKFRSSYLLYFLPLQAAKFVTVFQLHVEALDAAIAHGREKGVMRVADLGAGPGTASIALLLSVLDRASRLDGPELPEKIELEWWDTHRQVMEDGKALVELLASHFPKLRGRVSVATHVGPWWESVGKLGETSLVLLGHVLNETRGLSDARSRAGAEAPGPQDMDEDFGDEAEAPAPRAPDPVVDPLARACATLLENARGGGVLAVEPAAKRSSQLLSRIRDRLMPAPIWGPCLHSKACPLADGRDWCHFSVPVQIPGKWFRELSRSLASERQWVKFSYVWLTSPKAKAQPKKAPPNVRRVISDPLVSRDESPRERVGGGTVLVCEPERPGRAPAGPNTLRGDLLTVR